ncbi:MAG: YkgJ family cysteine cluster protein [Deltaproteobacteria bacterium]|nr:YkgJ family cysteine cluster protein [Deltaproteobacteria bacterium]
MDETRVKALAAEVERLAAAALGAGPIDEAGCGGLLARVEERIARALAPEEIARPACGPGCSACCTVNVATLPLEGIAVAGYLRRALGPAEAARRGTALLAFHAQVRWCDDADRIRGRLTCPFLDRAGTCLVHPVRPLACREVSSLDAGACGQALRERAAEEGDGLVRMNLAQRALYGGAREALAAALAARGLDARVRDVSGMAGHFLADGGLVQAYAAGGKVPLS